MLQETFVTLRYVIRQLSRQFAYALEIFETGFKYYFKTILLFGKKLT